MTVDPTVIIGVIFLGASVVIGLVALREWIRSSK